MKSTRTQKWRQIIKAHQWLKLAIVHDKQKTRYEIEFYRSGKNRKFTKTIAFSEAAAIAVWNNLTKCLPELATEHEREQWVRARVVSPLKRNSSRKKEFDLNFGQTDLGKKLRAYCESYCQRYVSRSSKTNVMGLCRELARHAGTSNSLTPAIVESCFKSWMNPDNHKAPETLRGWRTDIKAIAKAIGVKDVDGLFTNVTIPQESQLKDEGVEYDSRKQRPLERTEAVEFIRELVHADDGHGGKLRSALILQMIFGWRPQEPCCAKVLPSSIYVNQTFTGGKLKSLKTARDGVAEISVARTPIVDAILLVTGCEVSPIGTKAGAKYFRQVIDDALGGAAKGLNRYCLRHTALTWLSHSSLPQKEIRDTAGHMSSRMLDAHYARLPVKDKRPWEEAMPLGIAGIPQNWYGFVLECVLAAKWPCIAEDQNPNDPLFNKAMDALKGLKAKRKLRELF
ncbi:MAG: hypothetical protein AB7F86_01270 [Bdellovibrionales bacterium]